METTLHRANTRGKANHGWLNSHHTFSFANYYNPERMGFGALRVINDDVVAAAKGFGTHPHSNMEIISVPLKGSLKHEDTMGNKTVIKTGEIQVMSAGTGIAHSEYNNSADEEVNFLQIWVLPKEDDVEPGYGQKEFHREDRLNRSQLVISPDGRDGSLKINQDAFFSQLSLEKGKSVDYKLYSPNNGVYLFVIDGSLKLGEAVLQARDGLGMSGEQHFSLSAEQDSEVLIMEVPL